MFTVQESIWEIHLVTIISSAVRTAVRNAVAAGRLSEKNADALLAAVGPEEISPAWDAATAGAWRPAG